MIEFVAFHLDNFTGYRNTTVRFSTEDNRPLTLIRGENQSGKTTMLRGLTWIVYGMDAMPPVKDGTHPVRPDFLEDGQEVHSGWLVFSHQSTGGDRVLFRLSREVVTKADGPHVVVLSERETLERHGGTDWQKEEGWEDASGQIQTLRRGYFRPELREIIFADADKAEEFVGGPEGSHSDEAMERSVTGALNRLLNIEVIKEAIQRADAASKHFRKRLDEKSDETAELPKLRDDLEDVRAQLQGHEEDLLETFRRIEEAKQRLATVGLELDKVRADNDQTAALQQEVSSLQLEAEREGNKAERLLSEIMDDFHAPSLITGVMARSLAAATEHLGGLKQEGILPPSELSVIPRLLREGRCLCGTECPHGSDERAALEQVLEASQEHAETRTELDEIRLSLSSSVRRAQALGQSWRNALDDRVAECAGADLNVRELERRIEQITDEMDELSKGNTRYEELEERREELQGDLTALRSAVTQAEAVLGARYGYDADGRQMLRLDGDEELVKHDKLPIAENVRKNGLHYRVESLSRTIGTRERTEDRAALEATQLSFAEDVRTALKGVLRAIREDQIPAVSATMNGIFKDVMQAGVDDDTAEVGVRRTTHGFADREYELFAKNSRGHDKAVGLLAGSERRAVATAFLLALVRASGERVPFVSDSLLHAVGGVVRTNLIRQVIAEASQAVMFAIRADLANPTDAQLLTEAAGCTYTVTNVKHHPRKIVREPVTSTGSKSVLCTCGPGQYCDICERVGDADDSLLERTPTAEPVN